MDSICLVHNEKQLFFSSRVTYVAMNFRGLIRRGETRDMEPY